MKRKISGLLAVIITAVSLAGCTNAAEDFNLEEKVHLRIVHTAGDVKWQACLEKITQEFMDTYPEIEVELYTPGNRSNRMYSEQLKILYAQDEFFDVLELREAPTLEKAGVLADMPESVEMLLQDSFTGGKESCKYLPMYSTNRGIIYNKKIFEQEEILVPQTWDEFLNACKVLQESGYAPLAVGGEDLWHIEFWGNFLFVNYMLDENQNIMWNKEQIQKMLGDFRMLAEKGYIGKEYREVSDSETVQEMATEKAAMLYTGAWMLPQIKGMNPEMELGFFIPKGAQGKQYFISDNSNCWGISKTCEEEAEKYAAAEKFLTFFYSEGVYEEVLSAMTAQSVVKREVDLESERQIPSVQEKLQEDMIYTDQILSNMEIPEGFRNDYNQILKETLWGSESVDVLAERLFSKWEGKL